VIYGKEYCYSCYFGFGKKQRMNAWVRREIRVVIIAKSFTHPSKILRKYFEKLYDYHAGSRHFESLYLEFLWSYIADTFLAPRYTQTSKESTFWSGIASRPDGPVDILAILAGRIIRSNLSYIPSNPLRYPYFYDISTLYLSACSHVVYSLSGFVPHLCQLCSTATSN
jgi:hypothetical protein